MTPITLLALTTVTSSGVGSAVDLVDSDGFVYGTSADLSLDVESSTGGSVTVTIETSETGTDAWSTVVALPAGFATVATPGVRLRTFGDLRRFIRARYVVTAGSHQLRVTGEAHVEYASPADLARLGLKGDWLEGRDTASIVAGLRASTALIDGAIQTYNPKWLLPLSSWRYDVREACCLITAADTLVTHGVEPNEQDEKLFDRAERAHALLDKIANGQRQFAGAVDRTVPA
jgi:hypothetical protein